MNVEFQPFSYVKQYKHVIFDCRGFSKTANIYRTTFQDKHNEELALAGNIEASTVQKT